MFQYEAKIIRIIDGDTLVLNIDLGFHVNIVETVRLARINTPETAKFTISGISDPAKDYIMRNCPPGAVCVVGITRAEKYGRWLAEVYFQPGVMDRNEIMKSYRILNDELVREGLAELYDGGKRD